MTNFQALTDAFAELERQADAASATLRSEPDATSRHRSRIPLVAASVIAVLGVAGGGTLLARNHVAHTPAPTVAGGHQRPTTMQSTAAVTFEMPTTPAELESRFRTVLGDTATFTVTDTSTPVTVTAPPPVHTEAPNAPVHSPNTAGRGAALPPSSVAPNGAAIVGTLTASGVTGGYDLQVFRASAGSRAMCDDPDRSRCTVTRLADGSSLAVGREPLPGAANAVTYLVDLVRPDGVEFIMHVSNERSPKGDSAVLAAQPPLTRAQMTAIVTSDRW